MKRVPWFAVGILAMVAGPAIYATRFVNGDLKTPWYMPILATLGVMAMLYSTTLRRGWLRIVGAIVFAGACGFEWYMLGVVAKTPRYVGPAQPGKKLPDFVATMADGQPLTTADLANGEAKVMLFFRGRW